MDSQLEVSKKVQGNLSLAHDAWSNSRVSFEVFVWMALTLLLLFPVMQMCLSSDAIHRFLNRMLSLLTTWLALTYFITIPLSYIIVYAWTDGRATSVVNAVAFIVTSLLIILHLVSSNLRPHWHKALYALLLILLLFGFLIVIGSSPITSVSS